MDRREYMFDKFKIQSLKSDWNIWNTLIVHFYFMLISFQLYSRNIIWYTVFHHIHIMSSLGKKNKLFFVIFSRNGFLSIFFNSRIFFYGNWSNLLCRSNWGNNSVRAQAAVLFATSGRTVGSPLSLSPSQTLYKRDTDDMGDYLGALL